METWCTFKAHALLLLLRIPSNILVGRTVLAYRSGRSAGRPWHARPSVRSQCAWLWTLTVRRTRCGTRWQPFRWSPARSGAAAVRASAYRSSALDEAACWPRCPVWPNARAWTCVHMWLWNVSAYARVWLDAIPAAGLHFWISSCLGHSEQDQHRIRKDMC